MAIEAALTVLNTHLVAAGAALTNPLTDVSRGLPTGGRQLRYYWGGEVYPPRMGANRTLAGDMVGQRFIIAATWPLTNIQPDLVTAMDIEMQVLAGDIRSRIDGDSQLGGNITDLELGYATADDVLISNARHVVLRWDLDMSYTEATLAQ